MLSAKDFANFSVTHHQGELDVWESAFSNLLNSRVGASLTDGELQKLCRSFVSASEIEQWLRAVDDSVESANMFFLAVDQSPFNLKDWIQAVNLFGSWLKVNGAKDLLFERQLEYIGCCEEFCKMNPALTSLPEILKQMLDQHGIDRQT